MSIDKELLETIASINDLDDLAAFFNEIMTPSEREDLSLRWHLMADLHQGLPQRKIAEKYGISLCKITRGSKILRNEHSVTLKILDSRHR
ncbi:MAG: transcriptional regulator [Desulfobacteraceae bacterium]|nr:MAG: transcriptional regulator [Desulfobacteraceae bacterium]